MKIRYIAALVSLTLLSSNAAWAACSTVNPTQQVSITPASWPVPIQPDTEYRFAQGIYSQGIHVRFATNVRFVALGDVRIEGFAGRNLNSAIYLKESSDVEFTNSGAVTGAWIMENPATSSAVIIQGGAGCIAFEELRVSGMPQEGVKINAPDADVQLIQIDNAYIEHSHVGIHVNAVGDLNIRSIGGNRRFRISDNRVTGITAINTSNAHLHEVDILRNTFDGVSVYHLANAPDPSASWTISQVKVAENGSVGMAFDEVATITAQNVEFTDNREGAISVDGEGYIPNMGLVQINSIIAERNGSRGLGGSINVENTSFLAISGTTGANSLTRNGGSGVKTRNVGQVTLRGLIVTENGDPGLDLSGGVDLTINALDLSRNNLFGIGASMISDFESVTFNGAFMEAINFVGIHLRDVANLNVDSLLISRSVEALKLENIEVAMIENSTFDKAGVGISMSGGAGQGILVNESSFTNVANGVLLRGIEDAAIRNSEFLGLGAGPGFAGIVAEDLSGTLKVERNTFERMSTAVDSKRGERIELLENDVADMGATGFRIEGGSFAIMTDNFLRGPGLIGMHVTLTEETVVLNNIVTDLGNPKLDCDQEEAIDFNAIRIDSGILRVAYNTFDHIHGFAMRFGKHPQARITNNLTHHVCSIASTSSEITEITIENQAHHRILASPFHWYNGLVRVVNDIPGDPRFCGAAPFAAAEDARLSRNSPAAGVGGPVGGNYPTADYRNTTPRTVELDAPDGAWTEYKCP